MRKLLFLVMFVPALAFGQAAVPPTVSSLKISTASPARYITVYSASIAVVANGNASSVFVPWAGTLVDVVFYQGAAGSGGTSYTVDIQKVDGASLLSTLGTIPQSTSADQRIDAKGELAAITGWTRPVIKTDGTGVLTKGTKLFIKTIESGTYTVHASLMVALYFEPPR